MRFSLIKPIFLCNNKVDQSSYLSYYIILYSISILTPKDDITPTIKKQKGSLTAFQKKLALMQKTQPRQAILAEQYGVGKIRFLITRPSISVKEALGGVL
jgi:predicted DNA-binding protein YlxM (UPF0122 family)